MSAIDELRAFLAARDASEAAVAADMRSVVLPGAGPTAIVLLHGLTASPPAWSAIAAICHAAGATVVVVRLPLHGHADRLTTALTQLTAELLTTDLGQVVGAVAKLGKRIVIGGHSLGGTLAIHAGATLPNVDRVVAIAPFLGIASLPHEWHGGLVRLIGQLPNLFLWWDPVARDRQLPAHGYPRYPVHALGGGLRIADAIYADALHAPRARSIELVINAQESSVNNRTVRKLAERWRSAGATIAVHQLVGLPPSHDIIEPQRSGAARARQTLVELLLADAPSTDSVRAI